MIVPAFRLMRFHSKNAAPEVDALIARFGSEHCIRIRWNSLRVMHAVEMPDPKSFPALPSK